MLAWCPQCWGAGWAGHALLLDVSDVVRETDLCAHNDNTVCGDLGVVSCTYVLRGPGGGRDNSVRVGGVDSRRGGGRNLARRAQNKGKRAASSEGWQEGTLSGKVIRSSY